MVQIPDEILDAAFVDGASRFQILYRIMLPLCRPAIGVMVIIQFRNTFNEFLYSFILTSSNRASTMPVAMAIVSGGTYSVNWQYQAVAAIMISIPTLIIFVAFQRFFIKGLMLGAVKG